MIKLNKTKRIYFIILPILVLSLNLLIKGLFLSKNSIAGNEPFSISHAQMDIISIIKQLSNGNNPPLYEIILHFWIQIFGISELSVRFPSLIFSCITVLFIYKLGIKHLNKRIAIYSSIVFIFTNYHIIFAHEARAYAFIGMLSIMSMYYYLELINVSGSEINKNNTSSISVRKKYAILLILNILIIYTHYFGFFILLVQLIYLLYNKQLLARFWMQLLMSIGIIMLFYIPNLFTFINRFLESSIHGTWVKPPDGIESLYFMIKNFSNAPVVATLVITSCAMALIKYVLIRKNENTKHSFKLMVFWFVFIFFFMFAISFIIPMFLRRYLMPGAVAFCLVIGISIDYLVRYRWYKFIIPGIICFAFIVTVQPAVPHKKDVKATIKKVKALKNQKTLVYLCPNWFDMNFVYYYNRSCFKNYNEKRIKENMYKCLKTDNIFPIRNQKQIDTSKFSKFNKVIYLDIHADSHYPDNGILKKLDRNLILLNKYDSKKLFDIYEYKIK